MIVSLTLHVSDGTEPADLWFIVVAGEADGAPNLSGVIRNPRICIELSGCEQEGYTSSHQVSGSSSQQAYSLVSFTRGLRVGDFGLV